MLPGVVTVGGGGVTTTELGAGAATGGAVFTEHAPSIPRHTMAVATEASFIYGSSFKQFGKSGTKPWLVTLGLRESCRPPNSGHT